MAESQAPSVEPAAEAKADGEAVAPVPALKEMKSVVLMGFGGLKMLKVSQKPEAVAADGEVLIRVKAWWARLLFALIMKNRVCTRQHIETDFSSGVTISSIFQSWSFSMQGSALVKLEGNVCEVLSFEICCDL